MHSIKKQTEIRIPFNDDFDFAKTFYCGQCFRWNADQNGTFWGVAKGHAACLRRDTDTGDIFLMSTSENFNTIWHDYFDFPRCYAKIRKSLCIDPYMTNAAEFGAGIRILRQDPWEALCSFILSQCNNIPRIKQIIETFCRLFGDPILFLGKTFYSFPSAEKTAGLQAGDLIPLKCGYRAPFLLNAAKAVASGCIDFDVLTHGSYENALKTLKTLQGVGDKVANCTILFGLHMEDAFPIDIWMKKAIAKHYPAGLDPKIFGGNAGLAQQYMFYYQRSGRDSLSFPAYLL